MRLQSVFLFLALCLLTGCAALRSQRDSRGDSVADQNSRPVSQSSPVHKGQIEQVRATDGELIHVSNVVASSSPAASFQRSLLYHPTKSDHLQAKDCRVAQSVLDVQVTAHDKLVLNGWLALAPKMGSDPSPWPYCFSIDPNERLPAVTPQEALTLLDEGRPLVIVFSGNGGHRAMRGTLMDVLRTLGADVLMFDYRGYGDNPGDPAEAHFVQDARAIWNFAIADLKIPAKRIVLYGESLGGGVATRLASDLCSAGIEPRGLIVQSSFNSIVDVGRFHFPILPVSTLSVDRFESERHITRVTCPYLHLHGEQDEVIPLPLGKKLFQAAPEKSSSQIAKQFVPLPHSHHNDVYDQDRERAMNAIREFMARL